MLQKQHAAASCQTGSTKRCECSLADVLRCFVAADYTLTLKRLVLRGMTLSPFSGEGGLPRLLPLGMFAAVPRSISIYDIRIVVSEPVFAECLSFFSQQLRTARDTTSGPSLHTVSSHPFCLNQQVYVFGLLLHLLHVQLHSSTGCGGLRGAGGSLPAGYVLLFHKGYAVLSRTL